MWTTKQLEMLMAATNDKNMAKIAVLMQEFRRGLNPVEDANVMFLKDTPDFFIAVYCKIYPLIDLYLSSSIEIDKITLYNALFFAAFNEDIRTLENLLVRYDKKCQLDLNYILPGSLTFMDRKAQVIMQEKKQNGFPVECPLLALLATNGKVAALTFLLSCNMTCNKGLNVNLVFHYADKIEGATPILDAVTTPQTNIKCILLLLKNGADLYVPINLKGQNGQNIWHGDLLTFLETFPFIKSDDAEQIWFFLRKWQSEHPRTERDLSLEHSSGSGSNSPASAGSADGSPTDPSAILQHSPPRLPAAAPSNGSPSSSSSGSNDEAAEPKVTYVPLPDEKIRANPDSALYKAIRQEAPLEELKRIFHMGVNFQYCLPKGKKINILQYAVRYCEYPEFLDYIVSHGFSIDTPNRNGKSALHLEADEDKGIIQGYYINKMKNCIRLGANVNAIDNCRDTPLHLAAAAGNDEIAAFLIQRGAHADAVNLAGLTPLGCADLYCDVPEFKARVIKVIQTAQQEKRRNEALQQANVSRSPASTSTSSYTRGYAANVAMFPPQVTPPVSIPVQQPLPPPPAQRAAPKQSGAMYYPAPASSSTPLPRASQPVAEVIPQEEKKSKGFKGFMKKLLPA